MPSKLHTFTAGMMCAVCSYLLWTAHLFAFVQQFRKSRTTLNCRIELFTKCLLWPTANPCTINMVKACNSTWFLEVCWSCMCSCSRRSRQPTTYVQCTSLTHAHKIYATIIFGCIDKFICHKMVFLRTDNSKTKRSKWAHLSDREREKHGYCMNVWPMNNQRSNAIDAVNVAKRDERCVCVCAHWATGKTDSCWQRT